MLRQEDARFIALTAIPPVHVCCILLTTDIIGQLRICLPTNTAPKGMASCLSLQVDPA